jgi:ABC-type proline/glycine betaine transport system substrate-binding protein
VRLSFLLCTWVPTTTEYSETCKDSHDGNVSKSGVACDQNVDVLKTIYRKDLQDSDPVLADFLTKMTFSNEAIAALLLTLRVGGGNSTTDEAACEWVRGNMEHWKHWIPIELLTSQHQTTTTIVRDSAVSEYWVPAGL